MLKAMNSEALALDRVEFDADLIARYNKAGPRYTSYPTAVQFDPAFSVADYRREVAASNARGGPLSIYVHIPFCDTVCFYCGCNKIVTRNHNRVEPYLGRLGQEIALQAELLDTTRPVDQLHLGGGTPTFFSDAELERLMSELHAHFALHAGGEYSIEIDPRGVGAERVRNMAKMGFNRISVGVQDFDPEVQRAVNRLQSEAETLEVLNAAAAEGFRGTNVDLIYGLPLQTRERFVQTLDRIVDAAPDRISVFNYAHLPERFKPQRQIRTEDLPSPAEKLAILREAIERLTAAGYVYIGMDHFARPDDELALAQANGTLHRNFQGYSTRADCDLIALGVSSIGIVADAYAQNAKDMPDYEAALERGELPLVKGVRLTADDARRRGVIMEIICHLRLDIGAYEARFGVDFWDYYAEAVPQLEVMQSDGLVEMSRESIRVLPAGRLLIRNICMVFDAYLERARSTEQAARPRFSRVI